MTDQITGIDNPTPVETLTPSVDTSKLPAEPAPPPIPEATPLSIPPNPDIPSKNEPVIPQTPEVVQQPAASAAQEDNSFLNKLKRLFR
ncbi:MAG: hypothetical protein US96_C0010G0006 [Candidatus Woesebacteria bacterium GW2011_GWB1_38_5b]|uniref:Uncharacterized protein n=1 Tax=Candidatus Woesebacteria bacterium GW2011_GWB1_38_5b TaxID=1618569 RepID=A0A0G0KIY3_9BACT|nr:MAG: hypothetical protein US96_C0010G0006 [Candidatus Woesebacteria bacterium GW2011_GWB1_38_5b]